VLENGRGSRFSHVHRCRSTAEEKLMPLVVWMTSRQWTCTTCRSDRRRPRQFDPACADGGFRRISPVAAHSGDRLLSEHTAGTQPCRREPLFMPLKRPCRRDRRTARSGGELPFPICRARVAHFESRPSPVRAGGGSTRSSPMVWSDLHHPLFRQARKSESCQHIRDIGIVAPAVKLVAFATVKPGSVCSSRCTGPGHHQAAPNGHSRRLESDRMRPRVRYRPAAIASS
jgi:hypothetical protein